MKKVVIFGSTGSVGTTLINILKKDKKKFKIELLTANKNYKKLIKQTKDFKVKNIIITNKNSYLIVKKILKNNRINIYNNFDNIDKILKKKKIDYVMSSISGLVGLKPTINIIKFTKQIAIDNKESIICGWPLIKKELLKYKTKFIPVDSEHYSIYSLLGGLNNNKIEKIYITASGGPFHNYPLRKFRFIKLKSALNHPNWKMGKKISIDSATMMNKVFEIIEAKKIFDINYNRLEILVHPKSYIHALVKFNNGVTKFLLHDTKMTIPIFNSLYGSETKRLKSSKLNFDIINNLNFTEIDINKFPVVNIIKKLPNNNSLYETVIVTVNDFLVNMFLANKIHFLDISKILLKVINKKEFTKYKRIIPRNVREIDHLVDYVSLKMKSLDI